MQFIEDKMHSAYLLRAIYRPSEAPPVPCLKELDEFIMGLESEDYSVSFDGPILSSR